MSNTMTRSLTALAVGGLASLALVFPAQADTCPAGTYPPSTTCVPAQQTGTEAPQGGSVTFVFTGFKPLSMVDLYLHSTPIHLGSFKADDKGTVTVLVKVPANFDLGAHTVTASGLDAKGVARTLAAALTVTPTTPIATASPSVSPTATGTASAGGNLPRTGLEVGAISLLGAGLLGAGGLAVVSSRKRRSSVTAS